MLLFFFQVLTDLSMSNCTIGDFAAANLACALENNKTLEKLSIESNNVSPQTLVKIFEVSDESDSGSTADADLSESFVTNHNGIISLFRRRMSNKL